MLSEARTVRPGRLCGGKHPSTPASVLGLLMGVQVLCWSFNYIFGKVALDYLDPVTLASFRLVLAGCLYLAIYLVALRSGLRRPPWPGAGVNRLVGWRDLPALALLGLCGVVINQGGFTISLDYTSVGHVAIIAAIGPVLVLLLAWLNGLEPLTPVKLIGMALSFAGVALLAAPRTFGSSASVGAPHSTGLAGDLIALASTAGFALFTAYAKRVAHRYDAVTLNTFAHLTGAVLMLPLAARQAVRLDWHAVAWPGWLGLIYMAVFASVIGYLAFYRLLEDLAASQVSSLNYLLPIFATTLGAVFLHERINRSFLAAGALVLVGVWLAERGRWRRVVDGARRDRGL
jgi:drug/metabolite transporter (DMT)-like permease